MFYQDIFIPNPPSCSVDNVDKLTICPEKFNISDCGKIFSMNTCREFLQTDRLTWKIKYFLLWWNIWICSDNFFKLTVCPQNLYLSDCCDIFEKKNLQTDLTLWFVLFAPFAFDLLQRKGYEKKSYTSKRSFGVTLWNRGPLGSRPVTLRWEMVMF